MQFLQPRLVRFATLASTLLAVWSALAQQANDPVLAFVGQWDLVGKSVSIKVHANRTVDHSRLGAGDIQHENVDYFLISYRHRHLRCRYAIKMYSENELVMTVAEQPSPPDCDLGDVPLRRAPKSAMLQPTTPEPDKPPGPVAPTDAKSETESGSKVSAESPPPPPPEPLTVFKDCDGCPEMIVVPSGFFKMGSPEDEPGRRKVEGPVRKVVFARTFAAGRYAVTSDQFNAFVGATGYQYGESCHVAVGDEYVVKSKHSFRSPGFVQDGRHPAVCLTWNDASAYVKWLSEKTGKTYRLLTEAEREYIARAGSPTPYWWGTTIDYRRASYDTSGDRVPTGPGRPVDHCPWKGTSQVNCFEANPWGFFQVHGNVAEWTQDCWNRSYDGAPTDGSAALSGDCSRRVLRGGAWVYPSTHIRSAYREAASVQDRFFHVGFRVARDLGP